MELQQDQNRGESRRASRPGAARRKRRLATARRSGPRRCQPAARPATRGERPRRAGRLDHRDAHRRRRPFPTRASRGRGPGRGDPSSAGRCRKLNARCLSQQVRPRRSTRTESGARSGARSRARGASSPGRAHAEDAATPRALFAEGAQRSLARESARPHEQIEIFVSERQGEGDPRVDRHGEHLLAGPGTKIVGHRAHRVSISALATRARSRTPPTARAVSPDRTRRLCYLASGGLMTD